jgi:AraC-like DNA-binding protein
MRLEELSPFVRQAILAKMSSGQYTSFKLKTRDHRLFYILGGDGSIVIEGKSYDIRSGMIVLFRSGTEYMWQVSDMRYMAVNFDYLSENTHLVRSFHVERAERVDWVLEPDASFSDAACLNSPIVIYGATSFEALVMSIVTEFSLKGEYSEEYISATLKLVLISIAKRLLADSVSAGASDSIVREIIAYIGRNYAKPIRNTDIASALHLNPSYMNRIFKAHTGISVRSFLIDYRINAAIDLISGGNISISELAAAVGFTDVPHFIKTFKAHTGKTPKTYSRGT